MDGWTEWMATCTQRFLWLRRLELLKKTTDFCCCQSVEQNIDNGSAVVNAHHHHSSSGLISAMDVIEEVPGAATETEEFPEKGDSPAPSPKSASASTDDQNDDQDTVDTQLFSWRFFDPDANQRVYLTSYGLDIADYYTKYDDEGDSGAASAKSLGVLRVSGLNARGLIQSKLNKLFKTKMHISMELELISSSSPIAREWSNGSTSSKTGPTEDDMLAYKVTPEVRTQDRSAKWDEEYSWKLSRQQLRRGCALRILIKDDFGMGPPRVVGEAVYPIDSTTMTLKPSNHQVQLKRQKEGASRPSPATATDTGMGNGAQNYV